jgi:hypothetical protein
MGLTCTGYVMTSGGWLRSYADTRPQAVWIVNMVNMFFWFIVHPTGPEDTIRTIVTSFVSLLRSLYTLIAINNLHCAEWQPCLASR